MPTIPMGIDSIDRGRLTKRANEAIDRTNKDVLDRPDVSKDRKVVIEISVKPHTSDEQGVQTAEVSYSVKELLPVIKHGTIAMADGDGGLVVSEYQDDTRQTDIEEIENVTPILEAASDA